MKEIISFHIGQCGLQLGHAVWELFASEHGLQADGTLLEENNHAAESRDVEKNLNCFFINASRNRFIPRTLMVDLEPTVADEIRLGRYKNFFNPENIISGSQCAGNNFSRGLFNVDSETMYKVRHELRKHCERADSIQAFVIYRGLGGGTGTGTTVTLCDYLLDYAKVSRIEVSIYPSPSLSTSTVEPYNAVLGEHYCMEDIDVGLVFDNEAMYDICYKFLGVSNPSYSHLNRLVAQVMSCITSSVRFESPLSNDLITMQTNLVPYPRIHFPMCNLSPLVNHDKHSHQPMKLYKIVRSVFEQSNQLVKCDTRHGRYIACSLFLRGNVHTSQVYQTLMRMKRNKTVRFVDWDPTGFKVGVVNRAPTIIPASMMGEFPANCTMAANHTSIGQVWSRLMHKFQMLYSKKAFLFWYVTEGLEEGEFAEALANMQTLVGDYKDVSSGQEEQQYEGPDNATSSETENSATGEKPEDI